MWSSARVILNNDLRKEVTLIHLVIGHFASSVSFVDINECSRDEVSCTGTGQCVNNEGSFDCICEESGYKYTDVTGCQGLV